MSLQGIIAISGMPGLYKVVAQARNGFIVESISDKKRFPINASHRISALNDISVYGLSDDIPLRTVLKNIQDLNLTLDLQKESPESVRATFLKVLPEFDQERVYNSDIKKIFTWFNLLNGHVSFEEEVETAEEVATEAEEEKPKAKKATKKTEDTTETLEVEAPKKKAAPKKKKEEAEVVEASSEEEAPKKKTTKKKKED